MFNFLMFLCAVGIIGYVLTYKPKRSGYVDSFHIITAMIHRERKSRSVIK